MGTHYHVGSNVPGYLPEGDTYTVSSKKAAAAAVADEVRRYRESEWDLPRNERRTGHGNSNDGYVHFKRPGDVYDLGISFWWQQCQETDCESDDD